MTKRGKATKTLRSQRWFDDPSNPSMTALYLERYLNYGLTRGELHGGPADHRHRPDGHRPRALQPPPPRAGQARQGRHPGRRRRRPRVPGPPDPGGRQAPDRDRSTATSPTSGSSRCSTAIRSTASCSRPAATRPRPPPDGGRDRQHPGHRRSPADRCSTAGAEGSARARARSSGRAASCFAKGEIDYDEIRRLMLAGGAVAGHCNTMGTALSMNCARRGARHVAARLRRHPGAPTASAADGATRPAGASSRWSDEDLRPSAIMTRARVRERDRRGGGARRLLELPAAPDRHRARTWGRATTRGLAAARPRDPAARRLPAGGPLPGRGLPSRRRRARRC